jgi:hypothetical protein
MALTLDGTNGIVSSGSITTQSATGVIFSDSSSLPAASSPYVLKNRIINGAMNVWQRGTSITVGSASYTYTADRYKVYSANTSTTVSRSTSVPTTAGSLFQYSFQLQRPNGNTGTNVLFMTQFIETANCYDLAGQSVTLSFWVKKGANYSGGNIAVQVMTGTVADQGGDPYSWTGLGFAIADSTYSPTTSWTRVTYTGTIASNALEVAPTIAYTPTGTAGADDSLYITGVQLEVGSTATPFERRLYGQELANCQRYFEISGATGATSNPNYHGTLYDPTSTLYLGQVQFQVTKRTAPTMAVGAGSTGAVSIIGISSFFFTRSAAAAYLTYWTASAEL